MCCVVRKRSSNLNIVSKVLIAPSVRPLYTTTLTLSADNTLAQFFSKNIVSFLQLKTGVFKSSSLSHCMVKGKLQNSKSKVCMRLLGKHSVSARLVTYGEYCDNVTRYLG